MKDLIIGAVLMFFAVWIINLSLDFKAYKAEIEHKIVIMEMIIL